MCDVFKFVHCTQKLSLLFKPLLRPRHLTKFIMRQYIDIKWNAIYRSITRCSILAKRFLVLGRVLSATAIWFPYVKTINSLHMMRLWRKTSCLINFVMEDLSSWDLFNKVQDLIIQIFCRNNHQIRFQFAHVTITPLSCHMHYCKMNWRHLWNGSQSVWGQWGSISNWWLVIERCYLLVTGYQSVYRLWPSGWWSIQYIPRNMHTAFALLCLIVVIHWLIFPYPSGLLHWHCDNLTIAPVPAKQPWWIWINTSCEFIMNDCITTTKQSTTKPCAYFLGYTVRCIPSTLTWPKFWLTVIHEYNIDLNTESC